jgi:3-dehydroquinate synthase
LGYAAAALPEAVIQVLDHVGLPTHIPPHLAPDDIIKAMFHDKKKAAGQLRFVLLREPGQPLVTSDPSRSDTLNTLTSCQTTKGS